VVRLLLAVSLVVLVVAGIAGAGSYIPPPGDCCPQWSPKGTQIVFAGNRGTGTQVGAVPPAGGPERLIAGIPVGIRSPDWTYVAYRKDGALTVSTVDGSGEHVLENTYGDFAWAPDSKRLAFVAADGSLDVVHPDGTGLATVAAKRAGADSAATPAWSPNGRRIAYGRGRLIHVVGANGAGDTNITPGSTRANVGPVWSPDNTRVAFWSSTGVKALLDVVQIGSASRTYSIPGAVTNGTIVFSPNGRAVYASGAGGLVGIDLSSGERHTLVGIPGGVFSPSGNQIAYAAGGECRDRQGIYVANADGSGKKRLTNSCRIVGTPGPDTLHGDFSRVVLGLGGNDTLYADDTYYFFDGNTLDGGGGNDRLVGGFARDTLEGGPGDDTLAGGGSADVLVGGPGHDHIDGGGGGDAIYARDGQRDFIACGRNGYGKAGRDVVYADRIDVVASDCDLVHRS
jgi:Tol biopolymer transport system component